ncbi:uclacyanin-3-like [Magnolia sinica]|uniref:uclacyanin-3-like n=1 Tax=Magnolia sinica TaxID=86752 RepID=UPI0026595EF1|nr:uclacyanin-3-like [Magnolia sinica]
MATPPALLFILFAIPAAYAADYTVGDSSGWSTGVDYSTWASGKKFAVGDTLLFTYGGLHSVDEVSKSDYDSCSSSNAINSFNDGNTSIALSKAGAHYFLCPAIGHCSQGMKLAVTVSASGSPTPGGTPSTTPGTPSTSTRPSGATAKIGHMNAMGLGVLMVLAPLIMVMG